MFLLVMIAKHAFSSSFIDFSSLFIGTTKKSRVRVSQYPAKQWHIFLNYCVFIRRVIKANMLKHVFLIRLHTSTHIYTHLHTPTYTCMHIHAPTCTYIHLHTPKYTYIHRLEYTSTYEFLMNASISKGENTRTCWKKSRFLHVKSRRCLRGLSCLC